jgi:hypothetical protein
MDIGVGAVMFSSGLSQRKVRESIKKGVQSSIIKDFIDTVKGSFIVIIMSFVRFFGNKSVNY